MGTPTFNIGMLTSPQIKPSRNSTLPQLEALVSLMENETKFGIRGRSKEARYFMTKVWSNVAVELNNKGPARSPKEWSKFWSDYKCRIRVKFSNGFPLGPLEKKVFKIITGNETQSYAMKGTVTGVLGRSRARTDATVSTSDDDSVSFDSTENTVDSGVSESLANAPQKETISFEQRLTLLDFMKEQVALANGLLACSDVRLQNDLLKALARRLNALGRKKSPDEWYQIWTDWKAAAMARGKNKNDMIKTACSSIDAKLLEIIGPDNVDSHSKEVVNMKIFTPDPTPASLNQNLLPTLTQDAPLYFSFLSGDQMTNNFVIPSPNNVSTTLNPSLANLVPTPALITVPRVIQPQSIVLSQDNEITSPTVLEDNVDKESSLNHKQKENRKNCTGPTNDDILKLKRRKVKAMEELANGAHEIANALFDMVKAFK